MERTKLKILRIKKKMTQGAVAKKMGVSTATYSFIESGKRNGSIENWVKLQEIFKLKGEEVWELIKNQPER